VENSGEKVERLLERYQDLTDQPVMSTEGALNHAKNLKDLGRLIELEGYEIIRSEILGTCKLVKIAKKEK
jgi:hypothetical protein